MATTLKPTDEQQMNVVRQFIGAMNKLPIGAKINFSCEPFKTDDKATVWFTHEAWEKMCALINAVGEKEVGWHATVERNDEIPGHNYMVTDILVYPQEVGAATVNTDQEAYQNWLNAFPDEVFNNIRGQFHSHVNFSPSPSPTDDAHVESIVKQLSYFYEKILIKQLIVPGYLLYEVRATYARWLKPNKYYVAATNKQEAKRRFQNRHTWLNVIKNISLLSAEETEVIINEPRKHLIF